MDWYFTRDKSIRVPGRTLLSVVFRTLCYHAGSVAFGSLIIAIVQTARAILDYIDEQFRSSHSDISQFIMKCCKCCLWCLEKVCTALSFWTELDKVCWALYLVLIVNSILRTMYSILDTSDHRFSSS